MLQDKGGVHKISKAFDANKYQNMSNVTSEIISPSAAIEWTLNNKYKRVTIYYDYEYIENWVTGAQGANKHITRLDAQKMKEYQVNIQMRFVKGKSYSGDEYNDKADELAK